MLVCSEQVELEGRCSCHFAEIKLAVFAMLADTRLELVGGRHDVADNFNVTGNPPEGELVLKRISVC